jgi:hypothetical protein
VGNVPGLDIRERILKLSWLYKNRKILTLKKKEKRET